MHCDENPGPNGFNIKRRKSLSLEEKRELDMEVLTGKVNQLGIERDFMIDEENSSEDHDPVSRDNYQRKNNNNKKQYHNKNRRDNRGGNNRNRNPSYQNNHNNNSSGKKSLLGGVLNLFRKK